MNEIRSGNEEAPPLSKKEPITQGGGPNKAHCFAGHDMEAKRKEAELTQGELVCEAEDHFKQDRLLAAARVLRAVERKSLLLTNHHKDILSKARLCESLVHDLKSPSSHGWTKQGESHRHWDSMVYFQLDKETKSNLTIRVETPVEPAMLVPLLSVLNETELYPTWLPRWKWPVRFGVQKTEKLQQSGRAAQIFSLLIDMPLVSQREVVLSAFAADDIDANGDFCIKLHSLEEEDTLLSTRNRGGSIKTRGIFEGGFLFRKCPPNHPAVLKSKSNKASEQELILVSFTAFMDAKVKFFPRVINFFVRTVAGRMWNMFLNVAEDVMNGRRPEHAQVIAKKGQVLYDWVDECAKAMIQRS